MSIVAIDLVGAGDIDGIQAWLDSHSSVTIKYVSFYGNFCYIFYE